MLLKSKFCSTKLFLESSGNLCHNLHCTDFLGNNRQLFMKDFLGNKFRQHFMKDFLGNDRQLFMKDFLGNKFRQLFMKDFLGNKFRRIH